MRAAVLIALSLLLAACDRAGIDEAEDPGLEPGTFEMSVRQLGGSGFEDLAGSATFSEADGAGFVVRLASPVASRADTTTLDLILILVPGTATLAESAGPTALCYQSPLFQDGAYRAESGTLTASAIGTSGIQGTLDATAFVDLQTGPSTTTRIRVRIEGAFQAEPGALRVTADAVRRCEPG